MVVQYTKGGHQARLGTNNNRVFLACSWRFGGCVRRFLGHPAAFAAVADADVQRNLGWTSAVRRGTSAGAVGYLHGLGYLPGEQFLAFQIPTSPAIISTRHDLYVPHHFSKW